MLICVCGLHAAASAAPCRPPGLTRGTQRGQRGINIPACTAWNASVHSITLQLEMRQRGRAQLPLTAPGLSAVPTHVLPHTQGGSSLLASQFYSQTGGWTQAATNKQSQAKMTGELGAGYQKMFSWTFPQSCFDAIPETCLSQAHLHFLILAHWLWDMRLTCFLAFSSLACAFICCTSSESAFLLLMKRSWFPMHS